MSEIKIEEEVKKTILSAIEKTKKGRTALVNGTKNINAVRIIAKKLKLKIEVYNPTGEWNGYGYEKFPQVCKFHKTKIKNFLLKKVEIKKPIRKKTYAEKKKAWCKKLVKLTGITMREARNIAIDKENYQTERINALIERDGSSPSIKRGKLINKIERENPLRTIQNENHAQAILSASKRHNETNYEEMLEEGREQALLGEIEKNEVQDYARLNIR